MKFKSIFWLFNFVVVFALLMFSAASFLLFGRDYAGMYWSNMWVILLLFLVLIAILDFYFIHHWSLFTLLEKEDWPGLLAWLETTIYAKGHLRRSYASLLINAALTVSNLEAIRRLDAQVREKKPSLLPSLGVALGIPALLSRDWKAVEEHFGPLAEDPKTKNRDWARWCRALAQGTEGYEEMAQLLNGNDASVRLLAQDVLHNQSSECSQAIQAQLTSARTLMKAQLAGAHGDKLLAKSRESHLLAVVLSSRVNQAREALC